MVGKPPAPHLVSSISNLTGLLVALAAKAIAIATLALFSLVPPQLAPAQFPGQLAGFGFVFYP